MYRVRTSPSLPSFLLNLIKHLLDYKPGLPGAFQRFLNNKNKSITSNQSPTKPQCTEKM